ncbi:MAG TPA: amino acid adenylation domain-containing protein [Longimicrobium sp.]
MGADFLNAEPTVFWQDNAPDVRLMNEYGPTETVVGCSAYTLPNGVHRAGPVPVGRAIQNLTFFVLDGRMEPVPVGLPGELYIGGAGVARGYLGRPALSAEKFVPDPFAEPGSRMYRTGDRARWLEGGNLMILGRADNQVKIRGYRVELGEVEAALRAHPAVSAALAVMREDVPGDRRLVAYVVGGADAEALREHLRATVPEYMVPGAFVKLDALPRTATGKLDPKTLPAPEYGSAEERYVAPRTPVEETLAAIWAEVLRAERVGVEESFFELGGDSILSIQVVSRARRAGVAITPRQLFEHPTIAELASLAREAAEAPRAEQGRVEGAVAPTPIQAWFFEQGHGSPWHENQSVLLSVPGAAAAVLDAALPAVLEHHDALRLRFRRAAAGWEQWHAPETGIALERVDLSALAGDEQDRALEAAAAERQAGLRLEEGPLGRAVLFDRGERGHVLFLVLHHLVVDGVSWRILRDDLERACAQVAAGEPVELGEKSTSYREWSRALEAYAAGEALRAEAAHWLAQGPEGVAPLPVDGERGAGTVDGSRTVSVRLGAEETRALLQEVPSAYRTQVDDVLLCALAQAVSEWTGGARVRVALEGHGREEGVAAGVDLTRTVGWFTSLYPVVLDLEGAAGPGDRLKRVKEQLRAVPGRGIGYGVLRYLCPDPELRRALAAAAWPEIVFNYLGQFDGAGPAEAGFGFVGGARGPESAGDNRRSFLLEVNGSVGGGSLALHFTWGKDTHRRETVRRLADAYLEALRGLIAHCREEGAGGYTPSDFPLAELSQAEVDALLAGRRGVEDLYPLSPMQEGMLFHAVSGHERQPYQVQVVRRLEGSLDAALFRRAWAEVARRHAALRTGFVWRGVRRPLQRVEHAVEVPWVEEDWTGLDEAGREAALERYLEADRARGFDLEEAPLMRCALFRAGEGTHWFVWSLHHLLSDGWATARVESEAFRVYRAWSAGREAELRRARPFRDHVAWLARQDSGAAERYWRGVLAGFDAPTRLGVDRPAGPDAGLRNAQRRRALSPELTARLEATARERQVTLNTLLQGAWALLLSRYSGEDDVVFGATVSGRPAELEGVEEMIGVFINTLPVRVKVPGHARVGAWLAGLQRAQAEAREYEYAPLVQVQGWSQMPRGTPLFESIFIAESLPGDDGAAGGGAGLATAGGRTLEWNTFPLTLLASPGRRLSLALSYDESRFDAPAVDRMLEHLDRVLEALAADADAPLSSVSLVGPAERARLVDEWNRTARPYPRGVCIHERFEEQVRERPGDAALVWGSESLSYAELDARANRLAHHLAARGVGPDSRVAVLLERSAELVVSILAILKAGGCYVPLDPTHPAERLRFMLADSGVGVLVARRGVADAVDTAAVPVVWLDDDAEAIAARPADAPRSGATPENLAYVVYTSGSTGRPKGVMVAHRHVLQLVVTDYVKLGPGDRVAQATNASFDPWAFETWGALLNGATLVGIPREVLLSPAAVGEFLREERITTLYQTTALLNQLSREQPGVFASLREVLFGGQAADADRVRDLLKTGKPRRLLHMYGPTETTVWSSWEQVEEVADDALTVSAGRPTANQRIYILDASLAPLPVGVPGETYVGGEGIVRGYLNRPALTAERFLPDPFADQPGARMYRTGDRLRWTAGGALEFVGRVDEQVKIRGYRIEPGEVEGALSSHLGVREARVVARRDASGETRLVAYTVGEADAEALRAHLRLSLPEYMIPAAFVALGQIPLTPNGKLDVAALPAPEMGSSDDQYVEPRTPVEEVLAEVWREVLGVARVGRDDGFFELGGHSLLLMRLHGRLCEALGREVPIVDLFRFPTVASLAGYLEGGLDAGGDAGPRPGRGSARAAKRLALASARDAGLSADLEGGR